VDWKIRMFWVVLLPARLAGAETIWFTGTGSRPIDSIFKDQARRTVDLEKNRQRKMSSLGTSGQAEAYPTLNIAHGKKRLRSSPFIFMEIWSVIDLGSISAFRAAIGRRTYVPY
jgi:hypothetical protein